MTANLEGGQMPDPNQRLITWQTKTDTGRMKQTLDTLRPDMLKHYEAAVASLCEMETKARQTLNAAGVHTIMYVPFLSYARQLYKLSRQQGISGESFALGAEVLLDKWAARGLNPAVLAAIRTQVFDASAPTPYSVLSACGYRVKGLWFSDAPQAAGPSAHASASPCAGAAWHPQLSAGPGATHTSAGTSAV
jgi:hypothetical protein